MEVKRLRRSQGGGRLGSLTAARARRRGDGASGARWVRWGARVAGAAAVAGGEAWIVLVEPAWLAPAGALAAVVGAVLLVWPEVCG